MNSLAASMTDKSELFLLELYKSTLGDGEVAVGLALDLAERCAKEPGKVHYLVTSSTDVSKRTLIHLLRLSGLKVSGLYWGSFLDVLRYLLASLVAAIAWLGTLFTTLGDNKRLHSKSDILFAIHGECTNRTLHVLQLLEKTTLTTGVIVLGRPRTSLNTLISETFRSFVSKSDIELVRPFSLRAAVFAVPQTIRWVVSGLSNISRAPYLPSFKELLAIQYRAYLGMASAHWWRGTKAQPEKVIYGHTGLLDSTMLESEQQKGGVTTSHFVHGLSAGLNFVGLSTEAWFKTSHDAQWHQRLGGYQKCVASSLPMPVLQRGDSGWLIMSNLAHPMNRNFRSAGLKDEIELLQWVAKVADRIGLPRKAIVYKPHPVLNSLSYEVQQQLNNEIKSLRFRKWPKKWRIEEAVRFRTIISTPSTVVVDILRLGLLPVVINLQGVDSESSVAQMPYVVDSMESLEQAILSLTSEDKYKSVFEQAWYKVMPAASPNFQI